MTIYNKPLWLDLELREDVDDILTLIYALERGYNVEVVSIHNPSIKEINLLKYILLLFQSNADIVLNGSESIYDDKKDVNECYFYFSETGSDIHKEIHFIDDYLKSFKPDNIIVFCGGSLNTLSKLVDKFDPKSFEAIIQGGFASYKVVGEENTLKKFKNRERVPTWNLNLDIEATEKVLSSGLKASFVSKNVCHDSFVHKDVFKNKDSVLAIFANKFFEANRFPDKCMHDLLAFMTIDSNIVSFINVDLFHTNEERAKWWSVPNQKSSFKISTSFDKELFLKKIY